MGNVRIGLPLITVSKREIYNETAVDELGL